MHGAGCQSVRRRPGLALGWAGRRRLLPQGSCIKAEIPGAGGREGPKQRNCIFLAAAINNHKCLKTIDIYSFIVMEAGSLKSRCWEGHAPSKGCEGEKALPFSCPAFGGSRCSLACGCITPISASIFISSSFFTSLSVIKMVVVGFRAHPGHLG